MAYARKTPDSDVYVYLSVNGFTCCSCDLADRGYFVAKDDAEIIEHLIEHIRNGHKVPRRTIERLKGNPAWQSYGDEPFKWVNG
jgi:predicted small metal-binding protein